VKTALTPIDPSIYKGLLDQVADGVYIVDADRRIVCWNEGAAPPDGLPRGGSPRPALSRGWDVSRRRRGHPLCSDSCPLVASLHDGASHEVEVFLLGVQTARSSGPYR
jgi:hypothetical protein